MCGRDRERRKEKGKVKKDIIANKKYKTEPGSRGE